MSLLFLALGTNACGKRIIEIDKEYQGYVDRFFEVSQNTKNPQKMENIDAFKVVSSTPEELKELIGSEYVIGACVIENGVSKVLINKVWWESLKGELSEVDADREGLIFHEMGHCILGRIHDEEKDPTRQIPKSLMNTYHISAKIYMGFREEYRKELFENFSAINQR